MDGRAISFGPFRLHAAQRLLLEGDKPVRLGSRAFDILAVLVERAGEVVAKEELIARAWPQTFVEDSNLKIQVSALRRALGDGQGGHRYVRLGSKEAVRLRCSSRKKREPRRLCDVDQRARQSATGHVAQAMNRNTCVNQVEHRSTTS